MITLSEVRQKQHSAASSQQKRETVMKRKSIYRLLIQSEEKGRNILETALYALFAASALAAIWQFAEQPSSVPIRPAGSVLEQHERDQIPS
jgi:hypothetical protein